MINKERYDFLRMSNEAAKKIIEKNTENDDYDSFLMDEFVIFSNKVLDYLDKNKTSV